MASKDDEAFVTLATRIPKTLHHQLRIYSVETGISQMEFVCAALQEKLRESGARTARSGRTRAAGGQRRNG
jgi:hypothetical protein